MWLWLAYCAMYVGDRGGYCAIIIPVIQYYILHCYYIVLLYYRLGCMMMMQYISPFDSRGTPGVFYTFL
jgi:hypothetical protein